MICIMWNRPQSLVVLTKLSTKASSLAAAACAQAVLVPASPWPLAAWGLWAGAVAPLQSSLAPGATPNCACSFLSLFSIKLIISVGKFTLVGGGVFG